jgi:threonine/homoserine/homoserine lactone efflux protein
MFGTQHLAAFIGAGLLLAITPGPDMAYIIGRSSTQGARAGAIAALAAGAGCLVHISAAALGLSALIAASATAFAALKWIGVAYLCYVGWSMWRGASDSAPAKKGPVPASTAGRIFLQGFLTNVLNPKVALFFLAFLPQFVDPAAPSKPIAFLFLGLIFAFNGTAWNLFVAWSAARAAHRWRRGGGAGRWVARGAGATLIALAGRLALSEQR